MLTRGEVDSAKCYPEVMGMPKNFSVSSTMVNVSSNSHIFMPNLFFNKTVQNVFPLQPYIVNPPYVLATRCSHESIQSCNVLERARATYFKACIQE